MYSPDGYRAIRNGSAIVRRGDRGVLSVRGADRLDWLQGLLTNDVVNLQPGASRYHQDRCVQEVAQVNPPSDRAVMIHWHCILLLTAKNSHMVEILRSPPQESH